MKARNSNINANYIKKHLERIDIGNKDYGINELIGLMTKLLSRKIDYIFMLVPVSKRLFEGMTLVYEELNNQKIPFHYFITTFLGGAMVLFEKLFFEVGIRNFIQLAVVYHRINMMIPSKSENILNGEPLLTLSDVEMMMRIAEEYKLTVIDIYKIINLIKFKITDITQTIDLHEQDIRRIYEAYLEKKKK